VRCQQTVHRSSNTSGADRRASGLASQVGFGFGLGLGLGLGFAFGFGLGLGLGLGFLSA
jgi:hypothetical protein